MMPDLTSQQRAQRLAEYVRTISGGADTEAVLTELAADLSATEGVNKRTLEKATDTIRKSMSRGSQLSHDDIYRAEAIIHKTKRPSHLIEDGWFKPFTGDFKYMTEEAEVAKRIKRAIPSIGRIDLPQHPIKYGGTGFVVGKNLVMTNRHVADFFTIGVGRENVTIKPWQPGEIDFKKEFGTETNGFPLKRCVMIHPYWDMALFSADLPDELEPLELSTQVRNDLLRSDVVVIGYPAFDPDRNDVRAQQEIFAGLYNVKRIAPGRIIKRHQTISSAWLTVDVDALAHDSSTLGGNSGSAVFDVQTGLIDALHFAGRYLVENYGVPSYELARDPRIRDAGVHFNGKIPDQNDTLDPYWADADTNSEKSVPSQPQTKTKPMPPIKKNDSSSNQRQSQGSAHSAAGETTFEIPLRITVSLGGASPSQVTVTGASDDGSSGETGSSSATESPASGYDADFLSETVPTPELDADLFDDAVKLNGSPLLHYTHFSVCQSAARTLPRFVAWNIDGNGLKSLSRRGINFRRDNRIANNVQAGDELYSNNPYDRGHIARRADLLWGTLSEAKRANTDSFHFTNIAPQHESFNQSGKHGLWGELENAILEEVDVVDLRVSVIAGPIFREDDFQYRGVQIPKDFWKLIAFRDTADNSFKVAAYILSQSHLVPTEALELDPFNLYQVSLTKLANETDLGFDSLAVYDTHDSTRESRDGSGVREIRSRKDVI